MSRTQKPRGHKGGAPKVWRPITEAEIRTRVESGEFHLYALMLHDHPKDVQGRPLFVSKGIGGRTVRMPYLHVVHDLRRIQDSATWHWKELEAGYFFSLLRQLGLTLVLRTVGTPKVAVVNNPALSFRKRVQPS
jgi:hypothetical protein